MRFLSRDNSLTLQFALASAIIAAAQTASPTLQRDPRVENLLRQMRLEEKVAQLSQFPGINIPDFVEAAGQAEDVFVTPPLHIRILNLLLSPSVRQSMAADLK